MTPEQEAAAQMRTMVWLEAHMRKGRWLAVGLYSSLACHPMLRTWRHPLAKLPTMPGLSGQHQAIPRDLDIIAWDPFDPTDGRSYQLVARWRNARGW